MAGEIIKLDHVFKGVRCSEQEYNYLLGAYKGVINPAITEIESSLNWFRTNCQNPEPAKQVEPQVAGNLEIIVKGLRGSGKTTVLDRIKKLFAGECAPFNKEFVFTEVTEPDATTQNQPEYTGGSSSYYLVYVANPTTKGMAPYTAECNDIIEALGMNYAEGNAFKAIWRRKAAELGKLKKGYDSGLYDAEKVVFFGERMVVQSKAKKESK